MDIDTLKVFIVDDEAFILNWLVNNVEWDVYNSQIVGHTTNPADVIPYMEEHPVDLLITDIYMPNISGLELIRRVKERFPDIFIIVISAYDKFEYVKEAFRYGIIDYCLKPIDINALNACLKSAASAYGERLLSSRNADSMIFKEGIFQRLLSGADRDIYFDEQCHLAGISLDVAICQVVIIEIRRLNREKYVSILKRFKRESWEGAHCFLDSQMNLVLLFLGARGYDKEIEKSIKEILRQENIIYNTFLCIGKKLASYQQIFSNYQLCCDFLNASFLFAEHCVRTERYPYEKYLNAIKSKEQQRLINYLNIGNYEGVISSIKRITESCRTEEEKKAELICLAVYLVKNINTIQTARQSSIPKGYLEALVSSAEMLVWIENFYREIVFGQNTNEDFIHPYVKRALKEINQNYENSYLSLQEIAKVCSVSSSHLGKIFKEQVGEYFNDYLLKFRLKVAESLLLEKEMRIGTIAEKVGFSSQSYFNKMFRREYGVSPAEYRRRNREE